MSFLVCDQAAFRSVPLAKYCPKAMHEERYNPAPTPPHPHTHREQPSDCLLTDHINQDGLRYESLGGKARWIYSTTEGLSSFFITAVDCQNSGIDTPVLS